MQIKDSQFVISIVIILVIGFIICYYYKLRNQDASVNKPITSQTVEIVKDKSNTNLYPALVSGEDTKIRYNSPEFSYNPSSNTLAAGVFKGNLNGSASNIEVRTIPDAVIQSNGTEKFILQPIQKATSSIGLPPNPNGEYFISLTSGNTGSQNIRATGKLKYDNNNDVIMGKVQSLAGGSPGSIVYQLNNGQTTFLDATADANGKILVYDSTSRSPKWVDSSKIIISNPTSIRNIDGGNKGQILYQSGSGQTTYLNIPSLIKDPYLSFGDNGEPTWASLSTVNTNAGTVNVTAL